MLQPIIYSTLCMEGLRQLVARDYVVGEPTECLFLSRGVSDTYRVSAAGKRYALKVFRTSWRTPEAILSELTTLDQLSRRGIHVALPVPRSDGKLITTVRAPEGPRCAVLFEWAQGRAPKYTDPEHARRYGRLLALLHTVGNALPASPARPVLDRHYLLTRPLDRIRTRLTELPAVAGALAALEQRVDSQLARAEQQLQDWGFCHGDVWANNARIDGDRIVLFDFDFCGPGWQLFDIASYRWHARFVGSEAAAWPPFIEGYLEVRPDEARALRWIGLFMILKHLWTLAHFVGRAPETGTNFLPDESLEELVPFCERIDAEVA